MESVTWPSLPELADRATRAAQARTPGARVGGVQRIDAGSSSLTFRAFFQAPGERSVPIVLKVAPPGVPPVRNRDVLRQAALLRRLAEVSDVPVPAVILTVPAESLERPPLFAMAFVDGQGVEPAMDLDPPPIGAEELAARARHAARTLAAIHAVTPSALGIDTERPVSLAEEIGRWTRALATVDAVPQRVVRSAESLLADRMPAPAEPVLTHGDYRLGNLLCRDGAVRAVVDWEIWALSDPRLDLAWLIQFADAGRLVTAVRRPVGMPGADALIAEYRRGDPDLTWFEAAASFKYAAVCALVAKHSARRRTSDALAERGGRSVAASLRRTIDLLT